MKRKLKRAFTIVELVIVIAVIAILAAVLIPTFINVTKSAKQSSDVSAVRNMNTYLAVDEATKGTMTIVDVFETLEEYGISAENYSPLYSGRYFFYDQTENRVVYTESDYTVIYPEGMTKGDHVWYSLNGSINTSGVTVENQSKDENTFEFTVSSAAEFVKAAEYTQTYITSTSAASSKVTVTLSADIDLMGADVCFYSGNALASVTLASSEEGTQRTISGLFVGSGHSFLGHGADGTVSTTYGNSMFAKVGSITVSDIAVTGAVIGTYENSQAGVFAGQINKSASFTNVTVTDTNVYGTKKSGVLFGYATIASVLKPTLSFNKVTLKNNAVYVTQGEAGVLAGVITIGNRPSGVPSWNSEEVVTVNSLTLENNTIAFKPGTETYQFTGTSFTINGREYTSMPLNNEFGYKNVTIEDKVTNTKYEGLVFGLSSVCFVGWSTWYGLSYSGDDEYTKLNDKYVATAWLAINSLDEFTGHYFDSTYQWVNG